MFRVSLHCDEKRRTESSHPETLSADSFHRYNSFVVPKHVVVRRIDGSCWSDGGNRHLPSVAVVARVELEVEVTRACKHRWNAEFESQRVDGVPEVFGGHYSMRWKILSCWENPTMMTRLENRSLVCQEISTYLNDRTGVRKRRTEVREPTVPIRSFGFRRDQIEKKDEKTS